MGKSMFLKKIIASLLVLCLLAQTGAAFEGTAFHQPFHPVCSERLLFDDQAFGARLITAYRTFWNHPAPAIAEVKETPQTPRSSGLQPGLRKAWSRSSVRRLVYVSAAILFFALLTHAGHFGQNELMSDALAQGASPTLSAPARGLIELHSFPRLIEYQHYLNTQGATRNYLQNVTHEILARHDGFRLHWNAMASEYLQQHPHATASQVARYVHQHVHDYVQHLSMEQWDVSHWVNPASAPDDQWQEVASKVLAVSSQYHDPQHLVVATITR